MGTEQQQEINLPKPLPKPQRKTIPFTDKAIENWKPKKPIYFTNCKLLGSFPLRKVPHKKFHHVNQCT